MKCSKCGGEMLAGKVYIGGSATSFMLGGGLSAGAPLTFQAQDGREYTIQESSEVWPAHYCSDCGTVLMETDRAGLTTSEG
jgi:hypothetical protein